MTNSSGRVQNNLEGGPGHRAVKQRLAVQVAGGKEAVSSARRCHFRR